jgi:catechol 2,3-dioxygenase-like lactoylglutathione lyase family enzyme
MSDEISRLPIRLHHHAYLVRDQERTRHFYEDIIGMPLRATWVEKTEFKGDILEYSHTFYGLADGGALAFFNFADPKIYDKFAAPDRSLFYHIALSVDETTQAAIRERLNAGGFKPFEYDHGYCKSLYVTDPDGLTVEFTVDPPDVGTINERQLRSARQRLDAWQAGDKEPNNDFRTEHVYT